MICCILQELKTTAPAPSPKFPTAVPIGFESLGLGVVLLWLQARKPVRKQNLETLTALFGCKAELIPCSHCCSHCCLMWGFGCPTQGDGPRFKAEVAILTLEGPALMYFGLVEKKARLASISSLFLGPHALSTSNCWDWICSGLSFASAALRGG